MSGTFLGTGLGGGFFPAAAAPSALAPVYELKFDGVDAYGVIGAVGSIPAALQFDPATESWTCMLVARISGVNDWGFKVAYGTAAEGWTIEQTGAALRATVDGIGLVSVTVNNAMNYTTLVDQYRCIGMQWDHTTSTLTVDIGGAIYLVPTSVSGTPGVIDYSLGGAMLGVYNTLNPTFRGLSGGIAQVGVWTGTHLADIDVLWNDGVPLDWSTHTTPPDVLHYLIGSDDDATAANGIQDRTGNGLHMTMVNTLGGDIALRTQPRY